MGESTSVRVKVRTFCSSNRKCVFSREICVVKSLSGRKFEWKFCAELEKF